MLGELGFGLDLSTCAATGVNEDLIYVSPKSGGAISRSAGEPWRDRLLRLPPFLVADEATMFSAQDLQDGFAITGLFLQRHVLEPRGLTHSDARAGFIAAVMRNGAAGVGLNENRREPRGRADFGSNQRIVTISSSSKDAADARAAPRPRADHHTHRARKRAARQRDGTAAAPSARPSQNGRGHTTCVFSTESGVGGAQSPPAPGSACALPAINDPAPANAVTAAAIIKRRMLSPP